MKVITDNTASWNPWTGAHHAVYPQHGQFIAVDWVDRVELCDPSTLKTLEVLGATHGAALDSLTSSPDGRLLAYVDLQ